MTSPTTSTRAFAVLGALMVSVPRFCLSSNGVVGDALRLERRRIVEIAAVEDRRRLQLRLDGGEVRAAEFLPLGDDRERVGALERRLSTVDDGDVAVVAEHVLRHFARRGIVG